MKKTAITLEEAIALRNKMTSAFKKSVVDLTIFGMAVMIISYFVRDLMILNYLSMVWGGLLIAFGFFIFRMDSNIKLKQKQQNL